MAADMIFFSPPVRLYSCSNACNDGTHRNKLFFYPSLLKQGIKRNQVSSVNTHSILQACKTEILAGGERVSLIDRLGNVKDPRYCEDGSPRKQQIRPDFHSENVTHV